MLKMKMPGDVLNLHRLIKNEISTNIDSLLKLYSDITNSATDEICIPPLISSSINKEFLSAICKLKKPAKKATIKRRHLQIDNDEILFWEDVKQEIDEIITGTPKELLSLNTKYCSLHPCYEKTTKYKKKKSNNRKLYSLLEIIFNYEKFCNRDISTTWNAYRYCQMLNFQSCVYCNRAYIGVITNKAKWRPQLDHFFPKSTYPLLRLSIYNLLPSCPQCNSTKSSKEFSDSRINPFETGCEVKFSISPDYKNFTISRDSLEFEIIQADGTPLSGICLEFYESLGINEAYKQHHDEAAEIVAAKFLISDPHLTQFGISREWAYRFFLKDNPSNASSVRRPLGKLRKDIAESIGLLDEINGL